MLYKSTMRFGIVCICLGLFSCKDTTDPGDDNNSGGENSFGAFLVSLIAPTESAAGRTSLLGTIYDGPNPSPVIWDETATSGDCRLITPRNPFCQQSCGGSAACVADDSCQAYPGRITVGTVEVTGLQTTDGANTFSMDPIANNYQPVGITLAYPAFAEGDNITVSADGSTATEAFTISAQGIGQLEILNDSIVLADGQAIHLQWTPPGNSSIAEITVSIDISHHGGTKGLIECETADDGSLEIAASLLDQLKALGIAGFPSMEVTRISKGTNAEAMVDLVIQSMIKRDLEIPGLISCSGNEDCPDGQTCGADLKCQ